MVGRKVVLQLEKEAATARPRRARGRASARSSTTPASHACSDVSFTVRGGEIVGIAGVAGNGQTELLEALAGMRPPVAGAIRLNGAKLPPTGAAPAPGRCAGAMSGMSRRTASAGA
jgi:simple sugar transport system ATP-binding protein